MLVFLTTIVGAFIGAGLAPFIINFFGKRNKMLDKLREAYRLSEVVFRHFTLIYACNNQLISLLRNKTPYSPKIQDFFNKNYPEIDPMQEFVVLLDFDLGYQEDKMREFESICSKINYIKTNLSVFFSSQQYDDAEVLEKEKENENLHESIALFHNKIKSWCKAEKEATEIAYIPFDWYKRMKLERSKKLNKNKISK